LLFWFGSSGLAFLAFAFLIDEGLDRVGDVEHLRAAVENRWKPGLPGW
jgi:hypothetical protein